MFNVGRGGASGFAILLSSSRVGATDWAAAGLAKMIAEDANRSAGKARQALFLIPILAPLRTCERDSARIETRPHALNFV
jgi:hypothetical protein